VSKSGGIEDWRRVKRFWAGDWAPSGCCGCCWGSGSVAVDAEVDEDPELSPSVVTESVRSRVDDEAVGDCASASVAGTGLETERPVSCWLMPFCACET